MSVHRIHARHLAPAAAVGMIVAALAGLALATTVSAADGDHKVTLCHATSSRSNPYVLVSVDYHSIVQEGHGSHEGPVFSEDLPRHADWGDIIPAFDFGPGAQFDGQNLPEGQAILDGACVGGAPTTTTPTTWPPNE
jgi:hypothetical protein